MLRWFKKSNNGKKETKEIYVHKIYIMMLSQVNEEIVYCFGRCYYKTYLFISKINK